MFLRIYMSPIGEAKDGLKYVTLKYMYTAPLSRVDVDLTPGLIQNEGYEL